MKKSAFLSSVLLGACVLISGCAVRNPYISPTSGDTAKIRVIENAFNGTTFIHVTTQCDRASAKSIAAFSKFLKTDTSRADMYGSQGHENDTKIIERVVEANKEMNIFGANQGSTGLLDTTCFTEAAFTPKAGQQYEMVFTANRPVCNMTVSKLSDVDGKILKENIDDLHPMKKECRR
jgi:hypothetical protein